MREGEGTKFTIDRKIFSSDIWFASPWKLKIWLYLLGKANHADNKFLGIPIKRGQLIRSLRTIQNDCAYKIGYRLKKPSLSTVRRICEELTKDARITQRTIQAGTLFTICNYNDLQPMLKPRKKQRTNEQENGDGTAAVHNKNEKNDNNIFSENSDEFELSSFLFNLILKNNPKFKKPNLQKWCSHIDLSIRIDKRTPDELRKVIIWCQQDDFWKANILSTSKLRKQFDKLWVKMPKQEKSRTQKEITPENVDELYDN